jgi:hypothetical protein
MNKPSLTTQLFTLLITVVLTGGLWLIVSGDQEANDVTRESNNIDNEYFNSESNKNNSVDVPKNWKTYSSSEGGAMLKFSYPPEAIVTTSTTATKISFTVSGENYSNDVEVLSFRLEENDGSDIQSIASNKLSGMTNGTALSVITDLNTKTIAGKDAYSYETGLDRGDTPQKRYRRTYVPVDDRSHLFITTMYNDTYQGYRSNRENVERIIDSIQVE